MTPESNNVGLFYIMKPLRIPVVAVHVAGWILFQCLPVVFILSFSHTTDIYGLIFSSHYWMFCFYFISLFYLHCYILMPYLLAKGKWIVYACVILLLLISVIYLQPFELLIRHSQQGLIEQRGPFPDGNMRGPEFGPPPGERYGPERMGPHMNERRPGGHGPMNNQRRRGPLADIISIFLFIITLCLSAAVDIGRRWRINEQRIARAEADKVNAELSFLKAQINPHFLFNTLNNIYSMVMTNNEHTAESILKLSNILRYVTDESTEAYVSLQSEVDCITDYIDLQRLRLGKKVSLEYVVTGDLDNRKIAPMILMTFIENVFKYGTSNHEETALTIRLTVTDNTIHFFSQNKLFAAPRTLERAGIGINNTEKRLAHVYPGKHELRITRDNGLFSVDLFLQD